MRTDSLTVVLDFDEGVVVPENKTMSYVKNVINSELDIVSIGTTLILDGFRIAVKRGLISSESLSISFNGKDGFIDPKSYMLSGIEEPEPLNIKIIKELIKARISIKE
jgi:hypothetical protein